MNFIKIKDDYINLDNVTSIRVTEHEILIAFIDPDYDSWIAYQDDKKENNFRYRKLTTQELEQLKKRVQEKCSI